MKTVLTPARGFIAAALVVGLAAVPAQAQSLRPALEIGEQATRKAEQAQTRINQLDDERSDMVREFRTLLQRKDAAELYAKQQVKVVESQRRELESLNEQLGRVDEIKEQTVPMMLALVDQLEAFVAADLPFKKDIRTARINSLRAAMDNAQVAPAEAYRLIMEAYSQELEYGIGFSNYEETLDLENGPETVTIRQYGRAALLYLTQDQKRGGRYDRTTSSWVPLNAKELADLKLSVKVGEEKTTPQLLFVPVQKFEVQ